MSFLTRTLESFIEPANDIVKIFLQFHSHPIRDARRYSPIRFRNRTGNRRHRIGVSAEESVFTSSIDSPTQPHGETRIAEPLP